MSARSKLVAAAAVLLLAWVGRVTWDYFNRESIAHQAMQFQLKLFGAAMYEYHASTGRWPRSLDDLGQTSLPQRSYVWRQTGSTLLFLWPTGLKSDPSQNANILLAYDNAGLFNKLGCVWVCWGDLRTEYMSKQDLRARLESIKKTVRN